MGGKTENVIWIRSVTSSSSRQCIEIFQGMFIREIREECAARFGLVLDRLRLVFAGKLLMDYRTLEDYNIQRDCNLNLVEKPKPGQNQDTSRPNVSNQKKLYQSSVRDAYFFACSALHYQEFVKQCWQSSSARIDPVLLRIAQCFMMLFDSKNEPKLHQLLFDTTWNSVTGGTLAREETKWNGMIGESLEEQEENAKDFLLSPNLHDSLVSLTSDLHDVVLDKLNLNTVISIRDRLFMLLPPLPPQVEEEKEAEEKEEKKENEKEEEVEEAKKMTLQQIGPAVAWDHAPSGFRSIWVAQLGILKYIVQTQEEALRRFYKMFVFHIIDEQKGAQAKEFQKLKTCLHEIWAIKRLCVAFCG